MSNKEKEDETVLAHEDRFIAFRESMEYAITTARDETQAIDVRLEMARLLLSALQTHSQHTENAFTLLLTQEDRLREFEKCSQTAKQVCSEHAFTVAEAQKIIRELGPLYTNKLTRP